MEKRKKAQNSRELLRYMFWITLVWIILSFFGVMVSGKSVGMRDPQIWVNSLLHSVILWMIMAPAVFVMYTLPNFEDIQKRYQKKQNDNNEVKYDKTSSEGLGVPDDISKSGVVPENLELREKIWKN